MTDASGTSTSTYDSLGRLTEAVDGRGSSTTFAYDLADHQTSITYPNAKTVTRTFDAAGRTATITDWLGGKMTFAYDADSQPTSTTFPTASKNVDTYTYDNAGQLSAISIAAGRSTLASLAYARDNNGQVTNETPTGLPGTAQAVSYDTVDRVTQAGSKSYAYDLADHPTTVAGTSGYTYDAADKLTQSPTATYTYDTLGQRTRLAPTSGTPTTYAYDQAGRLTSPTTSSTTSYAYDGEGRCTSKTTGTTTTPYTWDQSTPLPLMLTDGATSYIYDPQGRPLEQITNGGAVTYYHHDQLGSTRMLTSATGTVSASYSYDAYGNQTGATGTATTPLGFAGEYKDADTGLIYLRARYYDPQTAQFLTRDPVASLTHQTYTYAGDNPINYVDPSGLVTIGACINFSASVVGVFGGSASGCVHVRSSGDVGATGTLAGGVGVGAGLGVTVGPEVTNAQHISDLDGPFVEGGGSLGLGGLVAGQVFGWPGGCDDTVVGGYVGLGLGYAAEAHAGGSITGQLSVNVPQLLNDRF